MRTFTLGGFANFTAELAITSRLAMTAALGVVVDTIKTKARSYYGHEDELPPSLSAYTQAERVSLGFSPNETLLRTGSLRDSLETANLGFVAGVGSADPRALWHELGFYNVRTSAEVPARPTLAKAAVETTDVTFALTSAIVAAGAGIASGPRAASFAPSLNASMALGDYPLAAGYVINPGV